MAITLFRIDDRLIHGQTTTRWSKARPVQGILVVSDAVAANPLRKKVLKAAAANLKLGVYPVDIAIEKLSQAIESKNNFFVISDSPQYFAELSEAGFKFGQPINIGPMNTREGTKVLGRTVAIDEKDYEAFETLEKNGETVYFQLLPDDDKKSWSTMKKKYDSM
ncbi:MAG: PTS sugar transporter subunit IIB [Tissierellia bacterium]|nr:PTS sugar transporter subunit IIB [Tissierellia bacterium]